MVHGPVANLIYYKTEKGAQNLERPFIHSTEVSWCYIKLR